MTSIVGGQLVSRTGRFKYQVVFGASVTVIAAILLQTLNVGTAKWHIAAFMVLFGLGSGLVGPTISVIVQSCVGQELMGVATSSRQFFMQIGQVLGVAIFGLIFTTTYASSFSGDISSQTRATLPTAAYQEFQDPTLALDPVAYTKVTETVRALPNGDAALQDAATSQKHAVATAIQRLFLGSTLAGIVVVILAITMKEIPLRRTFSSTSGGEEFAPVLEPALE